MPWAYRYFVIDLVTFLRLFQQTYIERILKRFNMQSCSSGKV